MKRTLTTLAVLLVVVCIAVVVCVCKRKAPSPQGNQSKALNNQRIAPETAKLVGRGNWGTETLGLQCRITTDKDEYAIGDPILVLVEVRNNCREPITLGVEPALQVGQGNPVRQPAEIHTTASQGGFFSTTCANFPKGTTFHTLVVVVNPSETYSEVIVQTPWGPTYSSDPSTAEPGQMQLRACLWQFLTPDLKKAGIQSNMVTFRVKAKAE